MSIELGIFARTFRRASAEDVAAAVERAGFRTTQLNLSCFGLPTLPDPDVPLDLEAVAGAFNAAGVRIWGLSGTFNMAHPDDERRAAETARAAALVSRAPEVGAEVVTLCTGSRDPEDMWRCHPSNNGDAAWADFRRALDVLLGAAERARVRLGIEPEPANVVSDAASAERLLAELGGDACLVGIVLDPANLVPHEALSMQEAILHDAFERLGDSTVALHAKDVVAPGRYAAAGMGGLDYDLIFDLHAALPEPVPVIVQDASEDDVARTRAFLLAHARP